MSRFKLFLPGLLLLAAVMAMSGFATASASADTCLNGVHFVWCNDNEEPLVGALITGTSELSLLAGHLGGVEARFHCKKDDFDATLGELGSATGLILFLECKEEKPAKCKLSAADEKEIDAKFTAQAESATLSTFTGSGKGEEFASLVVENAGSETCAVPGTYPVTGKQMVSTPEGGVSKSEHEIVALKSGSTLKLNGESASFSSTTKNAKLSSGLAWLLMEGE